MPEAWEQVTDWDLQETETEIRSFGGYYLGGGSKMQKQGTGKRKTM